MSSTLAPELSASSLAASGSSDWKESFLPPRSISASGMFGVITLARGSSSVLSEAIASSSMSLWPEVDTITGSSTMFPALKRMSISLTSLTTSEECSIPIFTASAPMSDRTASICPLRISVGTAWTACTPSVFCTVMAVIAVAA